jgi:glucan phosphoethanolaminetransferase (alkaline phosphatase superfamily)
MNDKISRQFRLLAVLAYINSAMSATSLIAIAILSPIVSESFALEPIVTQESQPPILKMGSIEIATTNDLHNILVALHLTIVSLLLAMIIQWVICQKYHPFVNSTLKHGINICWNIGIVMLAHILLYAGYVFLRLYSIFGPSNLDLDLFSWIVAISRNFVCACLAIVYFLNSIVAGIYAARGQYFKSFLIYPVIKV